MIVYICTFIIADKDCGRIQVSGAPRNYGDNGDYDLSESKSEPNNPVWKLKYSDRYIFSLGHGGFGIGEEKHIKPGVFYYKSKKLDNTYIKLHIDIKFIPFRWYS